MIKYYFIYLLVILSISKGGNLLDSLHGNYCFPDCKKFNSIFTLSPDNTFNFRTTLYGGNARWGSWEFLDDDKIKLKTMKIFSEKSYQMPPEEIIYITPGKELKIGENLYVKNTELAKLERHR
tara:strand:+ start:465 stop:833 length:369 start_codon:yes stop_codon:yes gene_type:complete